MHLILVVDMAFRWIVRVTSRVVDLLGLVAAVSSTSDVYIYMVGQLVVDILLG